MRKKIVLKIGAVLLIGGLSALFAFDHVRPPLEKKKKAIEPEVPLAPDSIASIRTRIHFDQKHQQLDTLFRNRVKKIGFNGCILVAQEGQIEYSGAFGFADLKKKDSLGVHTSFQLASASKTLTAAAILYLYDQGKLQLTDDVTKYLPEFPYKGISVALLLSHRSGLFNYIYACEPFCQKPNLYNGKPFDNAAMFKIIVDQKPAVYAQPNKKFEYCNTNYALLALIIEKVSGQSYAQFMQESIFQPLGMKDTWVYSVEEAKKHPHYAKGHLANGKYEPETYADDVVGDKGIYSSVTDMLIWDQALYSERFLKKSTIDLAFTGYSNEHKGKRNYGYGWRMIDDGKNPKIVYHNGWWHGFNSLFFRRPADRTTIIVLSNKYNRGTYQMKDVLAVLDKDHAAADMEGEE